MVDSAMLTITDSDALIRNFADLCLNDRYQQELLELVAGWTKKDTNNRRLRAAALVLQFGLRAEHTSRAFRRQIYDWAYDGDITARHAEVLVVACRDEMAVTHPEAALIRLLHLARRHAGMGAREAVVELAQRNRYLLRLSLDRLAQVNPAAVWPAAPPIFLSLADPRQFTDPGSRDHRLINEFAVRRQLASGWNMTFTSTDSSIWASRAQDWLRCASDEQASRGRLLDALISGAGADLDIHAQIYAMARSLGLDMATSRLLLDKITAAQSGPHGIEALGGTP
jgi:hypothetical protein